MAAAAPPHPGDASPIAIAISPLDGNARTGSQVWLGHRSRLTGDPTMPPATHRAIIAERTELPELPEFLWRGMRISTHGSTSSGAANAIVLGFMKVAAEAEDEFADWYETEHMPGLAALPGVLSAARYRAIDGDGPAYLALYRLEELTVSQSPQWMAAARTPWSARMRRFTFDYARYSFELAR